MSIKTQTSTHTADKPALKAQRSNLLQRQCICDNTIGLTDDCSNCRHRPLAVQHKAVQTSELDAVPPIVYDVLKPPGQPLDPSIRAFFEPRFKHNFSHVRVHFGSIAERSAQDANASAYTVRNHIVFNKGKFAPDTLQGQCLIAHELAHIAQVDTAILNSTKQSSSVESLEHEARQVASAVRSNKDIPPIRGIARNLTAPLRQSSEDLDRPTFGNLPQDEPDLSGMRRRVRLIQENGVWYEKRQSGEKFRARGSYDFVVQDGKVWAVKGSNQVGGLNPGHTEAAAGKRVEYAGTVRFGSSTKTRGTLLEWSNASGHYAPVRAFAENVKNAGLPIDKFKPVEGGFPEKGPQLPVFQPKPGETAPPSQGGTNTKPVAPLETKPTSPSETEPSLSPKTPASKMSASASTNKSAPLPKSAISGSDGNIANVAEQNRGTTQYGRVTVDYNLHSPDPKNAVKLKNIDLSDYPPEKKGPISRFFSDRPVLAKLSSMLASQAASYASNKALELIRSHFASALANAQEEFVIQFPSSKNLLSLAYIDEHRKAYEFAIAQLDRPRRLRTAALMLVVLTTPEEKVDAAVQQVEQSLAGLGIKAEDVMNYLDAAFAYESAMLDVIEQVGHYWKDLANLKVADDISLRAKVLRRCAADLDKSASSVLELPFVAFAPGEELVLTLWSLRDLFDGLGNQMDSFAWEITARVNEYQHLYESLDSKIVWIGNRLDMWRDAYEMNKERNSNTMQNQK